MLWHLNERILHDMCVCVIFCLSRSVLLFRPPRLANTFEDSVAVFKDYLTISSLRRFVRDHMWDSLISLNTATCFGQQRNYWLTVSPSVCVALVCVLTWRWRTEIVCEFETSWWRITTWIITTTSEGPTTGGTGNIIYTRVGLFPASQNKWRI